MIEHNWGRWGGEDERGAANLITATSIVAAAGLVRSGRVLSLSRPVLSAGSVGAAEPCPTSSELPPRESVPVRHSVPVRMRSGRGVTYDELTIACHGPTITHVDALCHLWDERGMWNGRDPQVEIRADGARWADVDALHRGIVTRAVLFDVPAFRGTPYVTQDQPVRVEELQAIAEANRTQLHPGDALVIYSGRERYESDNGSWEGHRGWAGDDDQTHRDDDQAHRDDDRIRPGLHASCVEFLAETDCSTLVWDMMDMIPYGVERLWSVHGASHRLGVVLVDNAELGVLATACAQEQRSEFLLVVAPLRVVGGSGSPVNPLALL